MASTSASSIQKSYKYDVFLSFRGEDTRKNFVDHLFYALEHKSVVTYKDEERINKGKRINDELNKSIVEDSKLYVIIFSKNYASSSWCLNELVKIIECQNKSDQRTAYPVFYDVDPTEVRNQSGAVGEAFARHEKDESCGKWREALKEASILAGWELKNTLDGHEAKFIKKIVEEISLKLRFIDSSVEGKLIGMESRVNDVALALETGSDDVRMIGIKGMGGGGKTTLARAVFDHISTLFEGKSFVENVREVSKASLSGLKKLQKQIVSDVLNDDHRIKISSVHGGKNMMKKMMCSRKVLVVLDDVDSVEQLEALAGEPNWFKAGSRIIITTRDEQVLVAHQVDVVHDVNLLSNEEAICLFSRYAFGKEIPIHPYKELSEQVVCYAAGLPLTIRVLGSFLCGKNEPEWKDAIERLETIPLKETLEKLELSYIGLEEDYKEIFLDVACILKGWPKDKAIEMLESCGFHARIGLKVLEQKSLITLSNHGYLGMHDHIEEMGKNIVRRLHPDEPNKHSRLWIHEEIDDILVNDSGTEATRCIRYFTWYNSFRCPRNMNKLRYLEIDWVEGSELDEDNIFLPNSLRFVSWYQYPCRFLLGQFQADNLVGLEMEGSNIRQLWQGKERKVLSKLRFLSLQYSRSLETLDLGLTPNLEKLNLEFCECLQELHMPVGSCLKLKSMKFKYSGLRKLNLIGPSLETLDLRNSKYLEEVNIPFSCPNLKSMYLCGAKCLRTIEGHGMTPNLERLEASYCSNLVKIHAPDECLKKLVYLDLSHCGRFASFVFEKQKIDQSPKVVSLSELSLRTYSSRKCPLHPLNDSPKYQFECVYKEHPTSPSFGNIEKLISLGLCGCTNLESFLRSLSSLRRLRKLTLEGTLSYTYIKHLPNTICMLKHLKSLQLNDCKRFEKLPEDIGQLQSLEELVLEYAVIKHLPSSLCKLKHLKTLKLKSCWHLEKLPNDFGQLESLEKLILKSSKIKHLPNSICMLKNLKTVKLGCCWEMLVEEVGLRIECVEDLSLC